MPKMSFPPAATLSGPSGVTDYGNSLDGIGRRRTTTTTTTSTTTTTPNGQEETNEQDTNETKTKGFATIHAKYSPGKKRKYWYKFKKRAKPISTATTTTTMKTTTTDLKTSTSSSTIATAKPQSFEPKKSVLGDTFGDDAISPDEELDDDDDDDDDDDNVYSPLTAKANLALPAINQKIQSTFASIPQTATTSAVGDY